MRKALSTCWSAAPRKPASSPRRLELRSISSTAPDCDGGYYRFLLDLSAPARLKLASYAEEMRKLGERDATGIDAAMAVLREARCAANHLLQQLTEFIAATAAQPSISCPEGRGVPALPVGFKSEASRS